MNAVQSMFVIERIDMPEQGGIYAYFEGVPYPSKGFPFPEAVYAANFAKRLFTVALRVIASKDATLPLLGFFLTPNSIKRRLLTNALLSYREAADRMLRPYYLEPKRYSTCCKEIRKFTARFLIEWGITPTVAEDFAETFATIIEYDNAYRLRVEDLTAETTQQKLLKSPIKEIQRLVLIHKDREPSKGGPTADKVATVGKLLSYSLLIPSIRRAFKKALKECDFSNFQLDDADRYHTLLWSDYNFTGKSIEERIEIYKGIHKDGLPRRITYTPAS